MADRDLQSRIDGNPCGRIPASNRRPGNVLDLEQLGKRDVARKLCHVMRAGVQYEICGRTDLYNRTIVHDRDPVGYPDRLQEIMSDKHDRLLKETLEANEFILHLAADERIEGAEGLVKKP